ncbi:SH3-binding, glutamic acid-rich protein, variant 2 [Dermatophagoides farinae]|uniref:SH3-binding, glutamic acid-rich protein, variant 2 n=1 Tax=Dermatophagoides farinae TaxID=6954 RepID=A0A922I391_DERFA|nr:SH3-binding, glutamic acid-rich protein, variant 2 [Dermatophagoides farinae]
MVVKVFISGISASKEVKKHQLRAQFLLDSYKIKYELIDIADPLLESQKEIMLQAAKRRNESMPPQPPQFFNDDQYCGDYEDLENANDNDQLFQFLKLEEDITIENGDGDENDLFNPTGETATKGDENDNDKPKENGHDDNNNNNNNDDENEDDDEDVKMEVREQVTINGVVYEIPPDRKINIGGRIIDVDELMKEEGDEIELDDVDDNLKDGILNKTDENDAKDDDDEDEEDEDEKE